MTVEITKKNQMRQHAIIIGFMAVITVCLFGELFGSNKMLASSDQIAGMGYRTTMQNALFGDGQIIVQWNKGILCGMPLLDAMGVDYFYPLSFPFNYFLPAYDFAWKMVLHVFLAGLFFYLMLLKGFGLSPFVAGVGAVFYMLNPEFFSQVAPGHDGKMYVIAWLPYMIWRLKEGLDKPNFNNAALLSLGIGMGVLTSHAQMMFFTMVGLGAVWLFFTIFQIIETKNVKTSIKPALFFWASVIFGLSLGAVQLYPTFQFVQDAHSVRGVDRGFAYSTSWSMHWAEIFSLWVPEFGNWFEYYWGENFFKLNTEYVGAVATITAALALVFKPSKWRFFWLAFGILILLFSMGADSPGIRYGSNLEDVISVYTLAYNFVFGIKKFRAISMVTFWFSFVIVLLSAFSLKDILDEEWKNFSETRLKKTKTGLLISIVAVVAISLVFANQNFVFNLMQTLGNPVGEKKNIFDANFDKNYIPALTGWVFIAIITLGGVWAVICGYVKKEIAVAAFLVLGMIDMIRVDTKFVLIQSNAQYKRVPGAVAEVLKKTKNNPARSMFLPGVNSNANAESFYGLEGVSGFHDNELRRYREFRGKSDENYLAPIYMRYNMGYPNPFSDGGNALNIANCRYIFYATQSGTLEYAENKNALERLAFTNNYVVMENREEISEKLKNPNFAVNKTVILEKKPKFESVEDANTQISVKWTKYTANERAAEIEVETDGILRISEVYYTGWSVFIDGKKQEVINSDLAFMAVEIPAGKHKVEMKVKSPYMNTAVLLSIPGFGFLLAVLGLNFARRKK